MSGFHRRPILSLNAALGDPGPRLASVISGRGRRLLVLSSSTKSSMSSSTTLLLTSFTASSIFVSPSLSQVVLPVTVPSHWSSWELTVGSLGDFLADLGVGRAWNSYRSSSSSSDIPSSVHVFLASNSCFTRVCSLRSVLFGVPVRGISGACGRLKWLGGGGGQGHQFRNYNSL